MDSIINRIEKSQFWKFHGGIHPPEQKFITENKPIRALPLPTELVIPIQQHIGQAGKIIVSVGDTVLKGQPLTDSNHPMAVPIHASTSGTITAIKNSTIAHPSGLQEPCVFLTPDGNDTWKKRNICTEHQKLNRLELLEKIANAGISGMGGAGFPTHIKASSSANIEFLIINAAECEPYITADDLLMREHCPTIIDGINILKQLINPKYILIGIEENKPEAIKALKNATRNSIQIKVCVIPTKYPSGGEKQLIQILTSKEIPSGSLPSSQGIIMQNIATCYAIADAVINDIPLIKRVTTVTGLGLNKPQNVWALLGTPVNFLLEQCEYQQQQKQQIIMGGPMMGFALPSGNVPVVKTTNCILAPSDKEIAAENKEVECIRCGQCADVCPAQLLPQELQWSAKAKDHSQLENLNLFDCIECGACAYVCPSHIPLVHYYRIGKAEIREHKQLEIKADKAKVRFEARKLRLERDKKAREEKQRKASEARKAKMNSGTVEANTEMSAVAAALARVKAKKALTNSATSTSTTETEKDIETVTQPKNPQIAAAIARAKAKKLAKLSEPLNTAKLVESSKDKGASETIIKTTIEPTAANNKKAKIAATIAKAKAKKLAKKLAKNVAPSNVAQSTEIIKETGSSEAIEKTPEVKVLIVEKNTNILNENNKKVQIAKTVAKVRAKKEDNVHTASSNNLADEDKKIRIAAAVAKAKAKKQQRSELK